MEANGKNIKKEGFFRAFIKSIKDFDKYEDFALESIGKTTVYLLKLIAIFTILVITIMPICFATSKSELKNQQSDIQNQISEKKDDLENVQTEKSDTLTEVENLTEKNIRLSK